MTPDPFDLTPQARDERLIEARCARLAVRIHTITHCQGGTMKRGSETPWGPAQTVEELRAGVTSVSTGGHGGILLSAERRAKMPEALRDYETYAGGNWYEEDEDVLACILAFPGAFDPKSVWHAVRAAQGRQGFNGTLMDALAAFITSPASELVRDVAATWETEHAGWWIAGSMGTRGKGWNVHFRQVGTDAECWRHVEGSPAELYQTLPGGEVAA